MKTKHSPGPWHTTRETVPGEFGTYTKIRDKDNGVIATLHVNEQANATLIVAAPDLLKHLKRLHHTFGETHQGSERCETCAVIAKAEGGAQ